jgi:lysophospholipase L1-like esterase
MKLNYEARVHLIALVLGSVLFAGTAHSRDGHSEIEQSDPKWVVGYAYSMQTSSEIAYVPVPLFNDQSLRMIVTPHADGRAVRIRLTNRFQQSASKKLVLDDVYVGESTTGAAIRQGSSRSVTFGGSRSVSLAQGGVVISDPIIIPVKAFQKLAVSFHVTGPTALDLHFSSLQTSYITPPGMGKRGADESGAYFTETTTSTFAVDSVDVLASKPTGAVVAFGDSLTDGAGSTLDKDHRWPDFLARLLRDKNRNLSVVNAGIGANQLTENYFGQVPSLPVNYAGIFGPPGISRLEYDVLSLSGVTDVIQFNAGNDIALSGATADQIIGGMRNVIARAHARCVNVMGVTLPPRKQWSGTPFAQAEQTRQLVNEFVRSSGEYDSVADFDAAVRDPSNPAFPQDRYIVADGVHFNDLGYATLANSIDVANLGQPSRCNHSR